ncbi:MAG: UvrD-helicase domain-containing protein [Pseudohongiellaceae bacterium]
MKIPIDAPARLQAQDITSSYAVQAPAGSGKTELLSLRFLHLLAICEKPEEVLAITFTRKAANEMANRILNTLDTAAKLQTKPKFGTKLEEERFSAAIKVLEKDARLGWDLLKSPTRLRIQTIDSFCLYLASRLPVRSGFGANIHISDRPEEYYQHAIDSFLNLLNKDLPVSPAIGRLLLQLDNNIARVGKLLTELLKKRDQWIEPIIGLAGTPDRVFNQLKHNIIELIEENISQAKLLIQPYENILVELASFAAANFAGNQTNTRISNCLNLNILPENNSGDLATWQGLADLLVTMRNSQPAWRKRVDKRLGFPSSSSNKQHDKLFKARKVAMHGLLTDFAEGDNEALLEILHYLRLLPSVEDQNFNFLKTLSEVLPTLLAQLRVTFATKNTVDYPEITHAALTALGDESNPTDLLLSLDYRINHILVDEFQDTSSTHQNLLQKLTAGWEPSDGRTFFVVGDAMQSCYSFRNANVGLFLALREKGIKNIPLTPIDLQANFRSDAGVVEWVNLVFASSFPQKEDISRGAVHYAHSTAEHPKGIEPAVNTRCYTFEGNNRSKAFEVEAQHIAKQITRLRGLSKTETIAILVRSRPHLSHILSELREVGIPWAATDIDKLNNLSIISDLTSLARAILNQADRLAWLAVLRAPWCGITIEDLLIITGQNFEVPILHSLCEATVQANLSEESYERIIKVAPALSEAVKLRDQLSLSDLLRKTFDCLGGHHLIQTHFELESVDLFFDLIRRFERSTPLINVDDLEEQIKNTFVSDNPPSASDNPIQILTIHKAKGLEFDHVFLPGLARQPKTEERELLLWHERLNHARVPKLFLAALAGTGESRDTLYELLRHEKLAKSKLENTRLMYIGVTRAIKSAHLSAVLKRGKEESINPDPRSLLSTIWTAISQNKFVEFVNMDGMTTENILESKGTSQLKTATLLKRIPVSLLPQSSWFEVTEKSDDNNQHHPQPSFNEDPRLNLMLDTQTGNLIHEALQASLTNKNLLSDDSIDLQRQRWQQHLLRYGFDLDKAHHAVAYIEDSLRKTLSNQELLWIFDHSQEKSVAEYELQSKNGDVVQNHIIDRSFLDSEDIRWIIDYKSAKKPDSIPEEEFIAGQLNLYRPQLKRYHELFKEEKNKGVKTALLFTSIARLVEVEIDTPYDNSVC